MNGLIAVPGAVSGRDVALIKAVVDGMLPEIRSYVADSTAPLVERIAQLEARPAQSGEPGAPGKDGESIEMAVVEQMIADVVAKAVSALPPAGKGIDGKDGAPGRDGADGQNGADGADGRDGADGKDGVDGKDGEPGRDGVDGATGERGLDGKDGNDGAGIADLLIDRDGALIATFTDGRTKSLGVVIGKDGANGEPGAAGRDGLSLDDFEAKVLDDGRTIRFAMTAGDTQHAYQLSFPVVIDRGVYREGQKYEQGDAVTWAGSIWIAQKETEAKPDAPDGGWRLSVKRGRDGKDKA